MGSAKKKKRLTVADAKPISAQRYQSATTFFSSYYFFALLLFIATALLYGHALRYPLVFDDLNFFVDSSLQQLGSSFFDLNLRWFSYASFGWTYKLVGHDLFWYRLGNLALHGFTSVLLYLFFSCLLDLTAQPQAAIAQPRWPAFFAALIFALHPAAVYGVAYLVERSIIMATLFGVAALLCYMEGLVRENSRWFVLSALFYFLAVFSKGQPGFFDLAERHDKLTRMRDPLVVLKSAVNWEAFRADLARVHEKERKSAAGAKPLDVVLMFKVLILQQTYNLSDEQIEYQIRDRLSFMRFLGLRMEDLCAPRSKLA